MTTQLRSCLVTTPLTSQQIAGFRTFIHHFYTHYGRHDLPWRQNYDPYHIMVSEFMLQQTQVDRVIPKFLAFINQFPSVVTLATAGVGEVITAWQGLGYNRRGLNLQRAAQSIFTRFHEKVPDNVDDLLSLPGIGPYTANAILTFAFNQPNIVVETNIRTVFIYHFFPGAYGVEDKLLLPLIESTLDAEHPRQWYSALMDYGSYLKRVLPNPTRQSKHYVKQSNFATSNRRIRGLVLRALTIAPATLTSLATMLEIDEAKVKSVTETLQKEGFIHKRGRTFQLAT